MSVSASARAIRQFLMSPGGSIPMSFLRRPELPPSSATVTMADILQGNDLRPRKIVERPVPPPLLPRFLGVHLLS